MKHLLQKPKELIFLTTAAFSFFLLRLPSLHEPHWYGDEGIYQAIGYGIRQGLPLYTGVWDNKPPLLYVIYALFNGDQFYVRIASLIFGIGAVLAFFFLSKKLFKKSLPVYITTSIFAVLFGLPMFEGNIANAENFMLFLILLAAFFLVSKVDHQKLKKHSQVLLMSGILLSVATLFKIVAIFDTLAFCLFITLFSLPKISTFSHLKVIFKKSHLDTTMHFLKPFLLGYSLPIVITSFYFLLRGSFSEFLRAVFTNNIGYVALENQLFFPQGLLVGKLLLLLLFALFFTWKKDNFHSTTRFILLWLGFSLFNAYFSNRPYTHYILVLLPSFSLAIGLLFTTAHKTKVVLGMLLVVISVLVLTSFRYTRPPKTVEYYANFISYITGKKDTRPYQAFFDRRTPSIYDVASYLRLNVRKNEQIFIWGDQAQLYPMTQTLPVGRYTVAYHMISSKVALTETLKMLEEKSPRLIVLFDDQNTIPFSLSRYQQKAVIEGVTIYERTF